MVTLPHVLSLCLPTSNTCRRGWSISLFGNMAQRHSIEASGLASHALTQIMRFLWILTKAFNNIQSQGYSVFPFM